MGASLSNCLGGPTASPPPRSPPKPKKAAPTPTKPALTAPAKAAHPKSPELLEVFGPEELYPLTDAMEKALKAQQLIFDAVVAEESKPNDSVAKNADPKWERNGGEPIEAILASSGLIDANYLIALAKAGGRVPFFEEVPSVARLGPKHGWRLKSWAGFGSNAVLAISAPWLDREHPDKHGATLRRMLPVLQGLVTTARAFASHEHATIGVFWDVCCIPRIIPPAPSPDKWRAEPPPPPAPAELARIERGLLDHARCLAHSAIHVLLVTDVPTGRTYTNKRPHAERGWSFYEEQLASLLKFDDCLWDLGKLEYPSVKLELQKGVPSYAFLFKRLARHRRPPMCPAQLATTLRSGVLHFDTPADAERAIKLYGDVFVETFDTFFDTFPGRTMILSYKDRGWNDEGAATLAETLNYAATQCTFPREGLIVHALTGNCFGKDAVALLKASVKKTRLKLK